MAALDPQVRPASLQDAESLSASKNGSAQQPPPNDSPGKSLARFADVYQAELGQIETRRGAAFDHKRGKDDTAARIPENLVGLALSGGGLRSATFNLGLLQAFRRRGLLRYVDYVSSVSGGGYAAGYLATAAHFTPEGKCFHDVMPPVAAAGAAGNKTPESEIRHAKRHGWLSKWDHRRWHDCGRYLSKPYEFFADYVLSTALMLALYGSGLLCLALMVAVVWRGFDYDVVSDRLTLVGWNIELLRAFLPCLALGLLWVVLRLGFRVHGWFRCGPFWLKFAGGCWVAFVLATLIVGIAAGDYRLYPISLALSLPLIVAAICHLGERIRPSRFIDDLKARHGNCLLGIWLVIFLWPAYLMIPVCFLNDPLDPLDSGIVWAGIGVYCLVLLTAAWLFLGTPVLASLVFRLALLSVLAAVFVLLASGHLDLDWVGELVGVGSEATSQGMLREPLVIFVLLCVAALFKYRSLLNSRRPSATFWERVAFRTIVSGIVLGVPLLMIGWAGRENISGYATYRDPDLLGSDILDWPAVVDLNWHKNLFPPERSSPEGPIKSYSHEGIESLLGIRDEYGEIVPREAQQWGDAWNSYLHARDDFRDEPRPWTQLQLALALERLAQTVTSGQESWERSSRGFIHATQGWLARAGMLLASPFEENAAAAYIQARSETRELKERIVEQRGTALRTPELSEKLEELIRLRVLEEEAPSTPKNELIKAQVFIDKLATGMPEGARLQAFWRRATDQLTRNARRVDAREGAPPEPDEDGGPQVDLAVADDAYWSEQSRKSFNRLLLEALYPGIFKSRVMVSTPVVIAYDEQARLEWLAFCGCIFTVLFLVLPMNRISPLHRFYRTKIQEEFLTTEEFGDRDPFILSKLLTCERGGAYHLFSAALHLGRMTPVDPDNRPAETQRHHSFLFSKLFCGARTAGYASTEDYPRTDFRMAEAVAISGAAISPMALPNGPLRAALTAFNLRTGLWIRNPRLERPKLYWVKPWEVLCEGFLAEFLGGLSEEGHTKLLRAKAQGECDWRIGSVSDGGYHEYLGLDELLHRRCRLIIVSDASCNGQENEFEVLADAVRLARVDHGIEILDLDDDRPLDIDRLKRTATQEKKEKVRTSPQHYVMGRIRYPEDERFTDAPREGFLLYLEMTVTGDENIDLRQYHATHESFPNEPTSNQFFDEQLVESYRALGYHVGEMICRELPPSNFVEDSFAREVFENEPDEGARQEVRNKFLSTDGLIHLLIDGYAQESGRERTVDASDFRSRLPFFPEVDLYRAGRDSATKAPPCFDVKADRDVVERAFGEREATDRYEQDVDYRREIWREVYNLTFSNVSNGKDPA